jgi:hypothetical protein
MGIVVRAVHRQSNLDELEKPTMTSKKKIDSKKQRISPKKPVRLSDLSVKKDGPKGGYIGETEKNLRP